jgi:hypothetical protein
MGKGRDIGQCFGWYSTKPIHSNTEFLRGFLGSLKTACDLVDLDLSSKLVADSMEDLPQHPRELKVLYNQIKNEMKCELYLHVPRERSKYWQMLAVTGDLARIHFPQATSELRAAASCYALALPAACVFHCMRALEHGLSALARDVGLTWTKEQWHNIIIEMIESKIRGERGDLPKGLEKDERLNFLSQTATEFFYFKDGWRNYVSHNRVPYDEPEAYRILEHSRAFIGRLAGKLKESPYHFG